MENFIIILNKPTHIFFPGEVLSGHLKIQCKDRIKINSITAVVSGEGSVYWSERETVHKHRNLSNHRDSGRIMNSTSHKERRKVYYRNHENYINLQMVLASKKAESDFYLECGEHNYPFQIVLPANLPTSFEHKIGRIRYSIKACIDIPWAFDKKTTIYFSILNGLDLNLFPNLRVALGGSEQKFFCCGPCQSEPVTAILNIPKSGFVPGERIHFSASLDNKSNRTIKELSIILIQRVAFHAKGKSKMVTSNVIKSVFSKTIEAKKFENWNDAALIIPPVCPSSNGSCRIIDVNYEIALYFASELTLDSRVIIPIVIGTVPIMSEGDMGLTNSEFSYLPSELKLDLNEPIEVEEDQKTDEADSNLKAFMPYYPYFKDFSMQKSQ
ncbi:arrestin domain-containing 3-like [Brachionus plicatilis]|uniref:Arrestin domain-containing 3-like n=1 Tax=Brachionus plicatilis TaxID=10195 RepID=A0A3M7SG23_BRAPC|nr:arrestin domain-containing 3-like [Brachionus plicatilis]